MSLSPLIRLPYLTQRLHEATSSGLGRISYSVNKPRYISRNLVFRRKLAVMPEKHTHTNLPKGNGRVTSSRNAEEWPASNAAMSMARDFLQSCAAARLPTLLVPDKDADGLCGTMIIYRTLLALGLPSDLIQVHFVGKGSNVHREDEQERMEAYGARFVVVVDQGSRKSGPLVRGEQVRALIVDHHWSEQFPERATVLSAALHPPIATSSALAYMLCEPLLQASSTTNQGWAYQIDYLCAMGTYGDLASFTFPSPWPEADIKRAVKQWGTKCLTDAVGLLNAPRRTATFDVASAWSALMTSPTAIVNNASLKAARAEVNSEISRCARNRPWFSDDGRVALIRVTSGAQIHPVIATRWTSTLKSSKLEIVMCANDGYLPGMTNFSCRVAKCAKEQARSAGSSSGDNSVAELDEERTDVGVNIIEILKEYARREPGLLESMGDDFARGHKEASGGIVCTEHFERLWNIMQNSEPTATDSPPRKRRKTQGVQRNTLDGWVKKG